MMKKILFLLVVAFTSNLQAQILFNDDLSVDLSASYTMIDNDGRVIDPFLTGQGVFLDGTWEIVNFGAPLGVAYYSSSRFSGADSCLNTSDWMVLPVLDFTSANNTPTFTFETGANFGSGEINVFATNTIAGTNPTVTDFTNPAISTTILTNAYQTVSVDLSTFSGDATVYIAIENASIECNSIIAVKDLKVKNTPSVDVSILTHSLITDNLTNTELAYNYSVADCGAANTSVDMTILNEGANALSDTVIVGYVYNDGVANVVVEDTIYDFLTTPLASNSLHVHTFSLDVDLSAFEVTVFNAFVDVENDGDTTNDINTHIIVSPNVYDLSVNSYVNSFEFDFTNDATLANTLATKVENNSATTEWTFEDFSVFSNSFEFLSDGSYLMQHGYIGDNATYPASDNWFFTPCITFDAAKFYKVSFDYNTFSGHIAAHNLDFVLASDYSSASVVETVINNESLGDTVLTNFSKGFSVATSGDYHFGIHDQSTIGFFLMMDLLTIEELNPPNAPSVSNSWNPCDSEATVTFNYSSENTYTIDWGDGNIETVTSSQATHVYTTGSTYTAIVTATNVAGSNFGITSVEADALVAPNADFTYTQNGINDGSVAFSANEDLPCNTYTWDFGDGNTSTSANASNTYVAAGNYNVSLTVTNSAGTNTTNDVIVFTTAIEDINFVNGIQVFPNPATDVLNIVFELNTAQDVEISLVSLDGKIINNSAFKNTNNISNTINTSGLSKGLYILDITTTEGKYTRNVVVK